MASGHHLRALVWIACACTHLAAAPTRLTLASSANPAQLGWPITFTATVALFSPLAQNIRRKPVSVTGQIAFYDGPTILGIRPLRNGRATFTTTLLPAGTRSIEAYYKGDAPYAASRSAPLQQMVHALPEASLTPSFGNIPSIAPNSLAIGDFNGDGIPDVAITVACPGFTRYCYQPLNAVDVALGKGDGSFGPSIFYPTTAVPSSVSIGDFNGDGIADLAVAAIGSVNILLGLGGGQFGPAISFPAGNIQRVVAADFNGDGIDDLACVGVGSVSVFVGKGDGSFLSPSVYTIGTNPAPALLSAQIYGIVVADFNHDGQPDVAACDGQSLDILLGNGDGSLQPPVTYFAGSRPTTLAAADFDGDGNTDLAVGAPAVGGGIYLLMGAADGTFRTPISLPVTDHSFQPSTTAAIYCLEIGDFNGDGKLDLAVLTQDTAGYSDFSSRAYVSIFLGNANGTFGEQSFYSVYTRSSSLGIADFNGDGRTDIAYTVGLYLGVADAGR